LIKLERIREREREREIESGGEIKHFYFWGGGQESLEESEQQHFVITPIYMHNLSNNKDWKACRFQRIDHSDDCHRLYKNIPQALSDCPRSSVVQVMSNCT
jgi:hypothetical protein